MCQAACRGGNKRSRNTSSPTLCCPYRSTMVSLRPAAASPASSASPTPALPGRGESRESGLDFRLIVAMWTQTPPIEGEKVSFYWHFCWTDWGDLSLFFYFFLWEESSEFPIKKSYQFWKSGKKRGILASLFLCYNFFNFLGLVSEWLEASSVPWV